MIHTKEKDQTTASATATAPPRPASAPGTAVLAAVAQSSAMGTGGCDSCKCGSYSGVQGSRFSCGTNIGPEPTYCNHDYDSHS